ncbi:MAG: ATP-binding protein [Bacteroidota bacterium]
MADWQKPETLAIWLTIGVTLVLFLVLVLILFTRVYIKRILSEQSEKNRLKLDHQKELLKDSIRVQERERNRIAADLHDGLIAKLNILLLTIHSSETVEKSTELLRESIGVARRISHDLSPPLLGETGLADLISEFVSPLRNSMQIRYYLSEHTKESLDNDSKLQLLRVVQEIISNTIKHSHATIIDINLRLSAGMLWLLIADNGKGFDVAEKHKGLGQKNIEMRLQLLKGNYRVKSSIDNGTAYLIYLPI